MTFDDQQLGKLSEELEVTSTPLVLNWAARTFPGRLAVSSSFQTQSVPLLHMLSRVSPNVPVLFLDTGFHFPETIGFRDRLVQEMGLVLRVLYPLAGHEGFRDQFGELFRNNPSMCCYLNKVEPLQRALDGCDAWITGIRRDQTPHRQAVPLISRDDYGRIKVCPMAGWTGEMINRYCARYGLPAHPLGAKGFRSIGCAPCTRATRQDEDARAGRWSGTVKSECGIHFDDQGVPVRGPNKSKIP